MSTNAKDGTPATAPAATFSYSSVYSFKGQPGDGLKPLAALTYDSTNGMFYGTTYAGGDQNIGVIFRFNPKTNAEAVVYSFKSVSVDGAEPRAALAYDPANGMFYGTTGWGETIVKFSPVTNAETTVYSFKDDSKDGGYPKAALTYDPTNGMFYGTTYRGGADSNGAIFKFNPKTNTETVVHSFGSTPGDGANLEAALTYDSANGMFYGMTYGGGAGVGTIFEFNPLTNAETVVHSFVGNPGDGSNPEAALTYDSTNGMFYGTTYYGGADNDGTILEFNPKTNALTVVHSFNRGSGDGGEPRTAMTYDSTKDMFYGTTSLHGATGGGTIFEFNPQTNAETVVHSFGISSGEPRAAFTYDPANGMFYGTTSGSGAGSNGTIFKFKP